MLISNSLREQKKGLTTTQYAISSYLYNGSDCTEEESFNWLDWSTCDSDRHTFKGDPKQGKQRQDKNHQKHNRLKCSICVIDPLGILVGGFNIIFSTDLLGIGWIPCTWICTFIHVHQARTGSHGHYIPLFPTISLKRQTH